MVAAVRGRLVCHFAKRFATGAASSAALQRLPPQRGAPETDTWRWALVAAGTAASVLAIARDRRQHATQCEGDAMLGHQMVLSADCGGTTTRLRLYRVSPNAAIEEKQEAPGTLICEEKFPNIYFKSLEDIIENFLEIHCVGSKPRPTVAVLAVAGIVTNNQCRFTNLDWKVDGSELAKRLRIARVEIINDFVAQGYGALTLDDEDLVPLNDVAPRRGAPIACIGAGTGLGQCFLTADPSGEYRCYPSEGGHAEFPPRGEGSDDQQIELLRYLKVKFSGWNRISIERVVSGKGICNIYEYLAYRYPRRVDRAMHTEFLSKAGDAGVIAKHATPGSLCEEALHIFAECYGAACGSFVIHTMPFRGLFITGGVSKKLAHLLRDEEGGFRRAFRDKGRVSPLLEQVPVFLVKSDDMGQRGAHLRSVRLLQEHMAGQEARIDESGTVNEQALVPPRGVVYDGEIEGTDLAKIVADFQSRNRRLSIGKDEEVDHEPIFKTMLWRVNRTGHRLSPNDWVYREMWISRNGNFCYTRRTTGANEVYFTREDLEQATVEALGSNEAYQPNAFRVRVPGFQPAIFAASSSIGRDYWMQELAAIKTWGA